MDMFITLIMVVVSQVYIHMSKLVCLLYVNKAVLKEKDIIREQN